MSIEEKYNKLYDTYFNDFMHVGDSKNKGENIPWESITNGKIYVGDGTINLSLLMQFIYVCNLNGIETLVTMDQCLTKLYKLVNEAYEFYNKAFNMYLPFYSGFFMRDDVTNENVYIGGYAGLHDENKEDPCYSPFVSQDQVWNLNPILMAVAQSDMYNQEVRDKAASFGKAINKYIKDNNYTIYDPYLSYIKHYFTYLPNTKLSVGERKKDRYDNFEPFIKVKRGANNWYYSGGTKSCVDAFTNKQKQYKGTLRTFLYKCIIFAIDRMYEPILRLFGKEFKHNSYNCYASTSGIWYNSNYPTRVANQLNKSLKTKKEFYNWNTDLLSGDSNKINWELVKQWLEDYNIVETNTVISPIQYLCVYQWYKKHLNDLNK